MKYLVSQVEEMAGGVDDEDEEQAAQVEENEVINQYVVFLQEYRCDYRRRGTDVRYPGS
jgi:hypothetical protein